MIIRTFLILLIVTTAQVHGLEVRVLHEGYTSEDIPDKVPEERGAVSDFAERYGIEEQILIENTNDGSVLKIISDDNTYYPEQIKIVGTEVDKNGHYNIYYSRENPHHVVHETTEKTSLKPFVIVEISGEDVRQGDFHTVDNALKDVVIVNNSISQDVKYTNVLKSQRNALFIDYFPLGKGNSWTYIRNKEGAEDKVTFEITSFSEGWSVFDNFFGQRRTGFRIDQSGELIVSTRKGIRPFYTEDVEISQSTEGFDVEAGNFKNVLIVRNPEKSEFKFRDVYAKEVGLIYHYHESPAGKVEYTLLSADVAGRQFPGSGN